MTLLLLAILPFALDDAPAILARLERLRFGDAPASRPATLAMRGHFQFTMGAQARDEPVNGPFEILFSGSKVCESMDYGSFGKMQRGSDGTAVWSVHPVTGVALVEGNGADTLKRMLEVTRGVTWRSVYVAAESAGTEMLDGRKHHVLRMKPEKGEPDRWWLDAESGLLTRWDVIISDMEGKPAPVHVEYEDWRTAAGALRPHREKVTMGTAVGVFVYDSIEANVDIPAERFAVPDAVTKAMEKDASKLGVQLQEHEEEHVATIRTKARREEVGRTLATLLPEVMAYLTDVHAKTTGPPFARYFGEEDGMLDLEAGLPVAAPVAARGRVQPGLLPKARVAMTWHVGPYTDLPHVHAQIDAWLREHGEVARSGRWEIYWTDPGLEQDPSKWRTQLFCPIEPRR